MARRSYDQFCGLAGVLDGRIVVEGDATAIDQLVRVFAEPAQA